MWRGTVQAQHRNSRLWCQTSPLSPVLKPAENSVVPLLASPPQDLSVRETPPPDTPFSAHSLEPGLDVAQPLLLLAGRGPGDLQ